MQVEKLKEILSIVEQTTPENYYLINKIKSLIESENPIGTKYIVLSDIQNVFEEGEIVTLKGLCHDGIHLYELGEKEVYMSDFEVKQILN